MIGPSNENVVRFPSQGVMSGSFAIPRRWVGYIDDLLAWLAPDLLRTEKMKAVNLTASHHLCVDNEERHCMNVRRPIAIFGEELTKQAGQPMQMGVAFALRARSISVQAVHTLVIRPEAVLGGGKRWRSRGRWPRFKSRLLRLTKT